ncbi:MAG: calcium/sodium antiporter [Ectothiorhodospiraceae bacterium]|nr:calcium/sodium antiporter [Ectothiorhodospiraceae bacterium]MCC5970911.1 calcium/sodium antiporter [Pararhodobacter sp.]
MTIALHLLLILLCFLSLAWSADRFVLSAGKLALRLGMAPVLVGLVIIGFGTSAPEILVSALASMNGNTGLAVGNALGSNVANIALILACAGLITPLLVRERDVRRELIALAVATLLVPLLLLDGILGRLEGALLIGGLLGVLAWLIHASLNDPAAVPTEELPETAGERLPPVLLWIAGSLLVLLASAQLLVWSAVELATLAGVSDLVIGLTIVALGTSLPELATAISAARRREYALVLGNILGSNLFNLLAVLGTAALIHPAVLPAEVLYRDYAVMAALTLIVTLGIALRGRIGRPLALLLLATYPIYQVLVFTL